MAECRRHRTIWLSCVAEPRAARHECLLSKFAAGGNKGENIYQRLVKWKRQQLHIAVFLAAWETEDVLREYMGVIHGCGIGAVCVEARPHPDFAARAGGMIWTLFLTRPAKEI